MFGVLRVVSVFCVFWGGKWVSGVVSGCLGGLWW